MNRARNQAVLGLFFLSGACSLAYESLWVRLLKLVFGNTTQAAAATISLFLGGLALGAFLVRRISTKVENRLKVYAALEAGITVCALLTYPALHAMDSIYRHAFVLFGNSPGLLLFLEVLLSSILLLVPTVLMGATLPLLSGKDGNNTETSGDFGSLYAANTLGAMAGTFLTGFYLIGKFGVSTTFVIVGSVNGLVAIGGWILSMRKVQVDSTVPRTEESEPELSPLQKRAGILLWLSGFVATGYEIVWIRTATPYLKATTWTFSAILGVYLAGNAFGAVFGSRWARRSSTPWVGALLALQLVGLCGLLHIPALIAFSDLLAIDFPEFANRFLFAWDRGFVIGYAAVLFFIPSFLMGLGFPLLVAAGARGRASTATLGRLYAANTLGAMLGPVAVGFCLIPFIGSDRTMDLLGFSLVLGGAVAGAWLPPPRWKIPIGLPLLLIAAAVALAHHKDRYPAWLNRIEGKDEPSELVEVMEGRTTTASVHLYTNGGFKVITTAGINVAGDQITLRQTQKAQGHIPVILHGGARSVLTVGFGSGELTRLLTLHGIPDITCVELSPEMVALAKRHFRHINLGDSLERKVHMVYMDAKNYVHLTNKTFDVVLNDAIWPGLFAENSSLYGREYFEDGKRILNEGGIYSTWLPISVTPAALGSILKTFTEVFPRAILIYPHFVPSPHILLVGMKDSRPFSYERMESAFAVPKVKASLDSIGFNSVDDILAAFFADESSLKPFAASAALNTDDHPVVEFDPNLYRSGFHPYRQWENLYGLMLQCRPVDMAAAVSFADSSTARRVLTSLARRQKAVGHVFMSFMFLDPAQNLKEIADGLAADPSDPDLLRRWEQLKQAHPSP